MLPMISQWRVVSLKLCNHQFYVDRNKIPDIIKEINHISFPYLSNLELESTGIESVESLTKI